MRHILVVEDEKEIQDFIKECLLEAGYEVTTADDGVMAIDRFNNGSFDLVLLDVMLPKIDGFAVCEVIRLHSSVPIIMLTAMTEEEDQVRGFDLLVNDYVCKPFSYVVLLKRIEAALRQNTVPDTNGKLILHDIVVNKKTHEVFSNNRPVTLTKIEYRMLVFLLENKGQVLTREQLLQAGWELDYYENSDKLVNHHIMNIRKKLETNAIETIRGVGYRIV